MASTEGAAVSSTSSSTAAARGARGGGDGTLLGSIPRTATSVCVAAGAAAHAMAAGAWAQHVVYEPVRSTAADTCAVSHAKARR
eukprot:4646447-Prymnesium_polylepis.2